MKISTVYSSIQKYVRACLNRVLVAGITHRLHSKNILRSLSLSHDKGIPFYISIHASPSDPRGISGNGLSFRSIAEASFKALAELIERHVWREQIDFFAMPILGSYKVLRHMYNLISPFQFVGFSSEQRKDAILHMTEHTPFLWVQGYSHTSKKHVWVPAQTVSGAYERHPLSSQYREPAIRASTSCGTAVAASKERAILEAVLELIERDAFLIMWLNQLTLPRVDLEKLRKESNEIDEFLTECKRHHIICHCIRLLTDAPTYVICVILEDSASEPRYTLGLRAGSSLEKIFVPAALEALRARTTSKKIAEMTDETTVIAPEQSHLHYWFSRDKSTQLDFLVSGPFVHSPCMEWDREGDRAHLSRLINWGTIKKYEFVSVSMTESEGNQSPWYIESVIIPELLPYYILESYPHHTCTRIQDIPLMFGYTPLLKPYSRAPHPFG